MNWQSIEAKVENKSLKWNFKNEKKFKFKDSRWKTKKLLAIKLWLQEAVGVGMFGHGGATNCEHPYAIMNGWLYEELSIHVAKWGNA